MLKLVELNEVDEKKEYAFIKDIPEEETGFENPYHGYSEEDFKNNAIPERLRSAKGLNNIPGFVPDTWYFLYDDNKIVSLFKYRHFLNEKLRDGAGHIGFYTAKSERGKGYASKGLEMLIEVVKPLMVPGEDKLFFSVNKDNFASEKVLITNGAYFHHDDNNKNYYRIRVR